MGRPCMGFGRDWGWGSSLALSGNSWCCLCRQGHKTAWHWLRLRTCQCNGNETRSQGKRIRFPSPNLLKIAKERVSDGDFRLDLDDMNSSFPWQDDIFDVVTAFNSVFFATDQVSILLEACRVTRPSGRVSRYRELGDFLKRSRLVHTLKHLSR